MCHGVPRCAPVCRSPRIPAPVCLWCAPLRPLRPRCASAPRIPHPESSIQQPESGSQTPDSGIPNPDSGSQTPESGIQNPDPGCQNPEPRCQNPKPNPRTQSTDSVFRSHTIMRCTLAALRTMCHMGCAPRSLYRAVYSMRRVLGTAHGAPHAMRQRLRGMQFERRDATYVWRAVHLGCVLCSVWCVPCIANHGACSVRLHGTSRYATHVVSNHCGVVRPAPFTRHGALCNAHRVRPALSCMLCTGHCVARSTAHGPHTMEHTHTHTHTTKRNGFCATPQVACTTSQNPEPAFR